MSLGLQQRLATMQYHLFERPVHPELFEIHEKIFCLQDQWEAHIWATGCSHVINFHYGKYSMVEVFADDQTPLPKHGRAIRWPAQGDRAAERLQLEGIHYQVNFQLETLGAAAYRQTHQELHALGIRRGRLIPFPQWAGQSLTPFSYFSCEPKPEELHVLTFHTFPEACSILKTQTLFQIA